MMLINPYIHADKWVVARDAALNSLDSYGYLARIDKMFVPKLARNSTEGREDWMGGTSATINGSASWSSTYGFVGSTTVGSYVDSGFIPSTHGVNYKLSDCSILCDITGVATVGKYYGKTGGTANQAVYLAHSTASNFDAKINSSAGGGTTTSPESTGFFGLARSASNAWRIDKDGSNVYTDTDTSGGLSTSPLYILAGRIETGSFVATECDGKIGMWAIGDDFTAAEQANIQTIFNTYYAAVA